MALKLSNMKSRVGGLKPLVALQTDAHGHRDTDARSWYGLAEWKVLRRRVFVRDLYTCQMCGVLCIPKHPTRMPIGDHKKPHRGIRALFFDPENVWTLCKSPCHDRVKQAEEAAERRRGG